jgi:hypothetical protein
MAAPPMAAPPMAAMAADMAAATAAADASAAPAAEFVWPVVQFAPATAGGEGIVRTIVPEEWKLEQGGVTVASRTQVPLKLAWAISIHKSQGMTLRDEFMVDFDMTFEEGQAYVALSRATDLENVEIRNLFKYLKRNGFQPQVSREVLAYYNSVGLYLPPVPSGQGSSGQASSGQFASTPVPAPAPAPSKAEGKKKATTPATSGSSTQFPVVLDNSDDEFQMGQVRIDGAAGSSARSQEDALAEWREQGYRPSQIPSEAARLVAEQEENHMDGDCMDVEPVMFFTPVCTDTPDVVCCPHFWAHLIPQHA